MSFTRVKLMHLGPDYLIIKLTANHVFVVKVCRPGNLGISEFQSYFYPCETRNTLCINDFRVSEFLPVLPRVRVRARRSERDILPRVVVAGFPPVVLDQRPGLEHGAALR